MYSYKWLWLTVVELSIIIGYFERGLQKQAAF